MYPENADIYLILVVVLTVYSRKHCMLTEDICFQAAYAKLPWYKGNTYPILTFTDFWKYTASQSTFFPPLGEKRSRMRMVLDAKL